MSILEFLVAAAIGFMAISIAMDIIIVGSKSVKEDCIRIAAHDESRLAFQKAVKLLRDSAYVIQNNDLDNDGNTDSSPQGVNFSLDEPGSSVPAVRDGLLVYTDSGHATIFWDEDPSGEPGHRYPDVFGFDDRDGDGKSDLLGFGLVPQDRNGDGEQDRLKRTCFSNERLPVVQGAGSDGYSPYYWKLVMVQFDNLSEVNDAEKWKQGTAIAYNLVPYITNYDTSLEHYDIITYEGALPGNSDYGHDGEFQTLDQWEGDGLVDEIEVGYLDSDSFDGHINSAKEIRSIMSIKFRLRKVLQVDPIRFDISAVETGITPRAFAMTFYNGLFFSEPEI
jgi:hypothetical protein